MRYRQLAGGPRVSALCLGTAWFGTALDDPRAFAILDRFREAGGTTIDTANCYAVWAPGGTGGESEALLGRWLASRGGRDELVLATKVGMRPVAGTAEGLSAPVIREQAEASLRRLGTDRIDLYYAHRDDRRTALAETLGAFARLVAQGKVTGLGASNHATWRIEQARAVAEARGWVGYACVQQRYSYVWPRPVVRLPEWGHVHASQELLDYLRVHSGLTMFAYSPLVWGSYVRPDRPLREYYDHPGTTRRLAVLAEVAAELGASPLQVVLAWLMSGDPPVVPVIGASSVAQLDECLAAVALELPAELRKRLDAAA